MRKLETKSFYNSEIPSDWSSPEFGRVYSFLKTFSFSRDLLTSKPTNDGIRNIHYGDLHSTFKNEILDLDVEKTVPYLVDGVIELNSFKDENFPILKDGDLVIADASEDYEGVCACVELKNINEVKIVAGLHTFAARTNEEKIALGYRTYSLKNEQVIREIRRIATGTSVFGVSKHNLSKVKIPIPPLLEQKAIAMVLSSADSAINAIEKLIAQKELRKKWLNQQLLTGKKRLKGFENTNEIHKTDLGVKIPKNWAIVKVKDIFVERKESSKDQSSYPLFSLTIEDGLTAKTDRYERSFLLKDKESNLYKLVYPNDILFNPMNLRFGAIAKSKIDKVVSVSAYYNSLNMFGNNADIDYFEALFKTPLFLNLYDRVAIGSLLEKKRVHLSNFIELEIPLPSKKEQTAIAQVLQTADKEIELLKSKCDKLKQLKKGMMQQLLTGKKRLKI